MEREHHDTARVLLKVENVSMTFPGTRALDRVDLDVRAGELHALVGHNGSGKSTLVKVLSGYHRSDAGARAWVANDTASLDEVPLEAVSTASSSGARRVSFVHQDLGLITELSALDNLALHGGFRTTRLGTIDGRKQAAHTRALLDRFRIDVDVNTPLAAVEPVERTLIAIAAALSSWVGDGGVLVLDEPTSALSERQIRRLFSVLDQLREHGAGIVLISHDLDEVLRVADRVTVLRGGQRIATVPATGMTKRELVRLMLGEHLEEGEPPAPHDGDRVPVMLALHDVSGARVRGVSLSVHEGEIVGVAGNPGSGADSLLRLVFDRAADLSAGSISVAGTPPVPGRRYRPDARIRMVPPDRLRLGVIREMSVADNLSLSSLDRVVRRGVLRAAEEEQMVRSWLSELAVTGTADALIGTLSGGNQQRVLVARAMATEPKILLLCDPTEGVDIGAREILYRFLRERAHEGLSMLLSSNDPADFEALCHRVVVLRNGRVTRELVGGDVTAANIIHAVEGVDDDTDQPA